MDNGLTVTKHATVRDYLLQRIEQRLKAHDRLPTERDLGEQLGVSRLTVRHALRELESQGLIYRIQGSGTFVAEPQIRKGTELTSFSEDMRARNLRPAARLLHASTVVAAAEQSWRLGVSPGTDLHYLSRIRLADDQPMCLEDVWLVASLAPGLLEHELQDSLYDTLERDYKIIIDRADQEVRATVLDPDQAGLLGVPPYAPALEVERVGYTRRGSAVEFARSRYRSDRYSIGSSLRRGGTTPAGPVTPVGMPGRLRG